MSTREPGDTAATRRRRKAGRRRLRVDPVACDGIGVCAHLLPRIVELDRWGYPLLPDRGLTRSQLAAARRATRACPRGALWIDER